MDPVSIVTLVGASLTITYKCVKIGIDINSIGQKLRKGKAEKKIGHVFTHVKAIKVASKALSAHLEEDAVGSQGVGEMKTELLEIMVSCVEVLTDLDLYVSKVRTAAEMVGFKGSLKFLWNEKGIREATNTLQEKEVAMLLMFEALKLAKKSDQRALLKELSSLVILAKARRPTSSIFGISASQRSSLRYSLVSDNAETFEDVFDFDREIMASKAYRDCSHSLVKPKLSTVVEIAIPGNNASHDVVLAASASAISVEHPVPTIIPGPPHLNTDIRPAKSAQESHKKTGTDIKDELSFHRYFRGKLGTKFARAMYDYEAEDIYGLSFEKGSYLQVLAQLDTNWWDASDACGRRGWVPGNYVRILEPEEVEEIFLKDEMDIDLVSDEEVMA